MVGIVKRDAFELDARIKLQAIDERSSAWLDGYLKRVGWEYQLRGAWWPNRAYELAYWLGARDDGELLLRRLKSAERAYRARRPPGADYCGPVAPAARWEAEVKRLRAICAERDWVAADVLGLLVGHLSHDRGFQEYAERYARKRETPQFFELGDSLPARSQRDNLERAAEYEARMASHRATIAALKGIDPDSEA